MFELFAVKTLNFLEGFSSLSIRMCLHRFSTIFCFQMTCHVNKKAQQYME